MAREFERDGGGVEGEDDRPARKLTRGLPPVERYAERGATALAGGIGDEGGHAFEEGFVARARGFARECLCED